MYYGNVSHYQINYKALSLEAFHTPPAAYNLCGTVDMECPRVYPLILHAILLTSSKFAILSTNNPSDMNRTLYAIHLCILLISFVVSTVNRKRLPGHLRLFPLLLFMTFVVESTAFYFQGFRKQSTQPLYHLFLPFLYSALSYIYLKSIESASILRKIIFYSIPVFIAIHIYLSIFVQKINAPNSYAFMLAAVLIVVWSLTYFYNLLQSKTVLKLSATPLFWISTGNVLFYSGAFFVMGSLSFLLTNNKQLASKLFVLIYVLNYFLYSLYTIGFLCTMWTKRSS